MKETTNLKLKKPDQNDFYNIDDFNNNSDIIDEEIGKIKEDLKNASTDAAGTSFDNSTNGMTATNVQDAIEENKTSISEANINFSNLKTKVDAGQNYKLTQDNGNVITLTDKDLNNAKKPGQYIVDGPSNGPSAGKFYIDIKAIGSNDAIQDATSIEDIPKKYSRVCIANSWKTWRLL